MKRIREFLATLPSTNARIAVTLLCVFLTGLVYWACALLRRDWVPDAGWLTFLVAMSGIDVAQFYGKRVTQQNGSPTSDGKQP